MVAQIKKELIKKIKAKTRVLFPILASDDPLFVQYIDQYQHIQIMWIEKDTVGTEDANGEEETYSLKELDIEILIDICDKLKIK